MRFQGLICAAFSVSLLVLSLIPHSQARRFPAVYAPDSSAPPSIPGVRAARSLPHRKLLPNSASMEETERYWGDNKCSKSDIIIDQGPSGTMPNGVPLYSATVMNACVAGGSIAGIHLNCGWFASVRLINPKTFKRLAYNDCLLNGGRPLEAGAAISFQYANSFPYKLSVASATFP